MSTMEPPVPVGRSFFRGLFWASVLLLVIGIPMVIGWVNLARHFLSLLS
jgi:hypothetical protein